jgi:hypothetical protein
LIWYKAAYSAASSRAFGVHAPSDHRFVNHSDWPIDSRKKIPNGPIESNSATGLLCFFALHVGWFLASYANFIGRGIVRMSNELGNQRQFHRSFAEATIPKL